MVVPVSVISTGHLQRPEIRIGHVTISRNSSWVHLDDCLRGLVRTYLSMLDPDNSLELNNQSMVCYQCGNIRWIDQKLFKFFSTQNCVNTFKAECFVTIFNKYVSRTIQIRIWNEQRRVLRTKKSLVRYEINLSWQSRCRLRLTKIKIQMIRPTLICSSLFVELIQFGSATQIYCIKWTKFLDKNRNILFSCPRLSYQSNIMPDYLSRMIF